MPTALQRFARCIKPSRAEWIMLCAVALAQGITLFSFMYQGPHMATAEADPASYLRLAQNVLEGHGLSLDGVHPSEYRPPVYPFFLASILFFTKNIWVVIVIQQAIGLATCLLVARIAARCIQHLHIPRASTLSVVVATLFGIEAERIQDVSMLYSETLFLFFILLSTWFFLRALEKPKLFLYAASGLFLGIATVTRPVTQAYGAVYAGTMLVWWLDTHRLHTRQLISGFLALSICFILIIAPWSIRNKLAFDTYKLSPLDSANFFLRAHDGYLSRLAKAGVREQDMEAYINTRRDSLIAEAGVTDLWTFAAGPALWRAGAEIVREDPVGYAMYYLKGIRQFFTNSAMSWVYNKVAGQPTRSYGLFYPLGYFSSSALWALMTLSAVLGLILLRKRWSHALPITIFLILTIAYHALLASFGATTRYRLPIIPALLTLVVVNWYFFITLFPTRSRRSAADFPPTHKQPT